MKKLTAQEAADIMEVYRSDITRFWRDGKIDGYKSEENGKVYIYDNEKFRRFAKDYEEKVRNTYNRVNKLYKDRYPEGMYNPFLDNGWFAFYNNGYPESQKPVTQARSVAFRNGNNW